MPSVHHLQSSTQIINLDGIRVLTDPWLTQGEYYGSWFHFPCFDENKITELDYDYIFVSHIHPDHLSEATFSQLNDDKPVLIFNFPQKFLKRKLEHWGFKVIELSNGECYNLGNSASVTIFAADNCNPELCGRFFGCAPVEVDYGSTQIDSLALFEVNDFVILNTNDCPIGLAEHCIRENQLHKKQVDLLLVGYAGAGPFPQCFVFSDERAKEEAAASKERKFLEQAVDYVNLIKPKHFAPFAGTYVLGSKFVNLNPYRGVPTVEGACEYISSHIVADSIGHVLNQGDSLDLGSGVVVRGQEYSDEKYSDFLARISEKSLDYEADDWNDDELDSLVERAFIRFSEKADLIGFNSETSIVIKSDKIQFIFGFGTPPVIVTDDEVVGNFVKIDLHHNLLNRLLRGPRYAHWNNAEIGSHLSFERSPDVYERGLYHALCFFHA